MDLVDTFLADMIKRWPTLRQTRYDALYDLCEKTTEYGDEIDWDADGNIAFSQNSGEFYTSPEKTLEEIEEELRAKRGLSDKKPGTVSYRVAEQMLASDILFQRREHAKEEFTRNNAELIVQSHDGRFGTTLPGDNAFRFLKEIPTRANPEWIKAFVELAEDILRFEYPASKFEGMSADYAARYQHHLDRAKENANEFLIRIKGTDPEKQALVKRKLEAEIEKLRKLAATSGLTLEATVA